jgi:hypothetical protein
MVQLFVAVAVSGHSMADALAIDSVTRAPPSY